MAGKLEVFFELNISDAKAQGAAAGRNFAQGFQDAFKNATASFRALNPDLFKPQVGTITPPGEAPGLRGILKSLAMGPLIPPNVIQGLKDVTGKELGKVFAMGPLIPPGVIHGLREQTGKDLAKVLSLPDITSFDKQPVNWKQGILGGLLGLRHPFIGARMMNEAGFFGGGSGGGKGGMGGLFGGGSAGFEKAFLALEGVKLAAEGVKVAFEHLKEAFEKGFKLFTESSRLGIKSGELFNREFAAKAIGVSVADIEKYMLRQQWGKARTSLQNFGAGSSIRNMNEMFQEMIQSGERLVPVMSRISGEFYRVGFAGIKLEREWEALEALMGEQLTKATLYFTENLQSLLQIFNDSGGISALSYSWSVIAAIAEKAANIIEAIIGTIVTGFADIAVTFKTIGEQIVNIWMKIPGFKALTGFSGFDTSKNYDGIRSSLEALGKLWENIFTKFGAGAIDPATQNASPSGGGFRMPQMGSWEKMGYVIGQRGAGPIESRLDTANALLDKIYGALTGKKQMGIALPNGAQGNRYNPA